MIIFVVYGFKILCEISKGTFEISHKIWTHTPQNMHFTVLIFCVWVTISLNCDVISLSKTGPCNAMHYNIHANVSDVITNPCSPLPLFHRVWAVKCPAVVIDSPVSHYSPSGDQHKQLELAHKSEQLTGNSIAIFHKYCCYIQHGVSVTHLNLWNSWGGGGGMLLICQNATVRVCGAWIRIYCVLG